MYQHSFVVISDDGDVPGLWTLLNSIYAYYGREMRVYVVGVSLRPSWRSALARHPLGEALSVLDSVKFAYPASSVTATRQRVLSHLCGHVLTACLLDPKLVLLSRLDDIFSLGDEGRIVTSDEARQDANGHSPCQVCGPVFVGESRPNLDSKLLCLNLIRHWDLAALWEYASRDPDISNSSEAITNGEKTGQTQAASFVKRRVDHEVLPSAFCGGLDGYADLNTVEIVNRDGNRLEVNHRELKARQRVLSYTGTKWWTKDGQEQMSSSCDALKCFRHFADLVPLADISSYPDALPAESIGAHPHPLLFPDESVTKHALSTSVHNPEPVIPPDFKLGQLVGPANLMWFVYPKRDTRDIWARQQEVLRRAIHQFDGKKVCVISCDDSTDAAAIDRSLWDQVLDMPNDPEFRELPGWIWSMKQLHDHSGFTVRLHAKGAARGSRESHMQRWWELGYEALLDVEKVRACLQDHVVAGPFRVYDHELGVEWHYCGSMYAFRNDAVFARDWMPSATCHPGWYVEAWPALFSSWEKSGCIKWEGVGDLYQVTSWHERSSEHSVCEQHGILQKERNSSMPSIAPVANRQYGWEGDVSQKPWEFHVTAVIPIIETVEPLQLIIDTLRLQTERPYIVLVDTGSTQRRAEVDSLRADDVEIHYIRSHAWKHPSEPVTAAMDLALSMCHTPYLFCTHSDCFIKRRELLSEMVEMCKVHKAVGYQLSPRRHPDWEWMLGHTCTMFEVATLDSIDATWSIRRLCNNHGVELLPEVCGPNWPDTELLINYQLRDAGIMAKLIGTEQNYERTNDLNIDHCRSLAAAALYSPDHFAKMQPEMVDAIEQAKKRIEEWRVAK